MFLKRLGKFFLDILEVVVFAIAIFLFVYLLIVQPHKIKGASMEPNYHNGEYLLTDKVSYRFRQPERGETIVFKAPSQNGEEFIKRIIALPGETVSIKEGSVLINGQLLDEHYLAPGVYTLAGTFIKEGASRMVPADEYFVIGDNRPFSSDSRAFGFVPKPKITGRAWVIYWPLDKLGLVEAVDY